MDLTTIVLIATSLSFGIFEISHSTGKTLSGIRFWQAVKVATVIVVLHIPILLAGWASGEKLDGLVHRYERWIALAILILLGMKMIIESLRKGAGKYQNLNSLTITLLLGMALAALFDALIIGISLAFLNIKMALPLLMITTITFFVSMAGIFRGKTAKHILIYKMKIPGGLVLIAAGIILFLNQNW